MKLCVAIPCFFQGMDFCDAVREAASLGYDTVETYDWKSLDLGRVKDALAETGVTLNSFCTTDFRMTDERFRGDYLKGLRESCEAAAFLGVKQIITQVGQDTGEERSRQRAAIVETLRQARPILEEYGVTLMPEPLNLLVNHPGYYLSRSDEAFDIIKEVDSPSVRLIYDIYHQQVTEGNILPTIQKNLSLIAHFHAAGHPGRHELQFGENDYQYIFRAIDAMGYTGSCGLEYSPTLDPIESLKRAKEIYG